MRSLDHLHGIREQDPGLLFLRSRRVHLGACFVICRQAVQANPASQRALSVSFALLNEGAPESPGSVCALPPEQRPDDESLAGIKPELLAPRIAPRIA